MSDKADVHAHAAEHAHTTRHAHSLSTDGVRYPLSDSNAGDPAGHEHAGADTLSGDNHRYAHLYANAYTDANTYCHAVPDERVSNSHTLAVSAGGLLPALSNPNARNSDGHEHARRPD